MRKATHAIILTIVLLGALPASLATQPPLPPVGQPPVADFVYAPAAPRADEAVTFESTSIDADGFIVLQSWTFEGSDETLPTTGASSTRAFPAEGAYDVTLRVVDSTGRESSVTRVVTVVNSPPELSVSATPNPGFRGADVMFAANATDRDGDAIVSWRWDFGDGATSTVGADASHTYAEMGRYTVMLHVTDAAGQSAAAALVVHIVNHPPVITDVTVEPPLPAPGDLVWFNATATDPDGAPGAALEYAWRFSDGVALAGASVRRAFPTVGHHSATVNARDAEGGLSSPRSVVVRVDHAAPTSSFAFSPTTPVVGAPVAFTDASTPANGTITAWRWAFGDGATSAAQHPTHAYSASGTYVAHLTVTDSAGRSASTQRAVEVNARPMAAFEVSPSGEHPTNTPLSFTDRSTDADGDAIVAWRWDFGDGATSTARDPTHAYAKPGAHNVTLEVTDARGATASVTRVVHVTNTPPVAGFTHAPVAPLANEPVDFTSTASDPDGTPIAAWSWQFGDGGAATGESATHTYAKSGRYYVVHTVSDGLNETRTKQAVDVAADHAVELRARIVLPDGRAADLDAPTLRVRVLHVTGAEPVELPLQRAGAGEVSATLARGAWQDGHHLVLVVQDTRYMLAPKSDIVMLHDADTQLSRSITLPMPLVVELDIMPGERAPLPMGGDRAADGTPIYRDAAEAWRGDGRVTFLDGTPVDGARGTLTASHPATGTCIVGELTTQADGAFAWSLPAENACVPGAPAHAPGRHTLVASASYGAATPGASAPTSLLVDPTGAILG